MEIQGWYKTHFESALAGRYITMEHLFPMIDSLGDLFEKTAIGVSELGKEIYLLKVGKGEKVVLGWSQMHGNESTTTKAIFDLIAFLGQKEYFQREIKQFLKEFTLFLIPMLNPDGAALYTRENANLVDLNRDAKKLTQSESRVLNEIFKKLKPQLCLNLHDQRSIYGLEAGLSATVSFLAPAADNERSITPSRKIAMEHIVRMNNRLNDLIPGHIGRYDDSFNKNCVGDTFQMAGVPTILFEAGHYKKDYNREKTREFIFYAFLELFEITRFSEKSVNHMDYFKIPENRTNFKDVILRNVRIGSSHHPIDVCIQYSEVLKNGSVCHEAVIDDGGECKMVFGHSELDIKGAYILLNSQEKISIGQKVFIISKKSDNSEIIF